MLIDPNSPWYKKLQGIMSRHLADLGGADNCTEAERSVIRRVGTLTIELEKIEARLAQCHEHDTNPLLLESYCRLANVLHKLMNMTGLEARRPKTITPSIDEYVATHKDVLDAEIVSEAAQ